VSGATWCSNAVAPGGQFFLVQQNDGNLCVHKGTSPSDDHGSLWCRFSEKPPVTLGDTSGGMELLDNQSDKFVWFTVYGNQILGAGCIPPGKAVYVQTNNVDHVRAEVMQYVGCAQPKVCDLSVSGVNLRYWQGEGLGVTPFKSCSEGFG
jgi:hypothetical protein